MSGLLSQLSNNVMYQIHKVTYNPDAENYAAQRAVEAADKSDSDVSSKTKSDISGADISGAGISTTDISGVMCFGETIQLGSTNFFKSDVFENYIQTIAKNPKKKYTFNTLNEAKAASQTMTDTTGILAANSLFYVYTGDTTLVDKIDPNSSSGRIVSQNPTLTFVPVMTCEAMADAEERKTFSINRLFSRAFSITGRVLSVFLLIALCIFSASLATNLNVYRAVPYRVLYAIYGAIFFFVVIPYVLLWRWAYQHKRPRFYALIPIFSTPFENPIAATLLSWFTFEPDDEMAMLDGCR